MARETVLVVVPPFDNFLSIDGLLEFEFRFEIRFSEGARDPLEALLDPFSVGAREPLLDPLSDGNFEPIDAFLELATEEAVGGCKDSLGASECTDIEVFEGEFCLEFWADIGKSADVLVGVF